MEKFLDISLCISNDKWINHKFQLQSNVGEMASQESLIHLQNMIGCLKFLMGHPGFWQNQTYEPSYVYNKNKHQVYNEMHTNK